MTLLEKYRHLLNFALSVKNAGCCNVCHCLPCDAVTVLRTIGVYETPKPFDQFIGDYNFDPKN